MTSDPGTISSYKCRPQQSLRTMNLEAFSQLECLHFTPVPSWLFQIERTGIQSCFSFVITVSQDGPLSQRLRISECKGPHTSFSKTFIKVNALVPYNHLQCGHSNFINKTCNCNNHFLCPFYVPCCSYCAKIFTSGVYLDPDSSTIILIMSPFYRQEKIVKRLNMA